MRRELELARNWLALGALGVGGGVAIGHGLDKFGITNSPQNHEYVTNQYVEQIYDLVRTDKFLLQNYQSRQEYFENILSNTLDVIGNRVGGNSQMVDVISQKAKEHILTGAVIASTIKEASDLQQVLVYRDGNRIDIDDMKFDLQNSLDFHLAANLISLKFDLYNYEAHGLPVPQELEDSIADIKWLAKTKPSIVVEKGAFAILPRERVVAIAKILKVLQQAEIQFPNEIRFKNYIPGDSIIGQTGDPGAGWYNDHRSGTPFTIVITNNSDEITFPHEVGHFLSDAHNMRNSESALSKFSQKAFNQIVEDIATKYGTSVEKILSTTNTTEEYAEAFRKYLQRGDGFRHTAREDPNVARKALARTQYEFIKQLLKGREFRYDYIPVEHLDQNTLISPGDFIEISDVDLDKPGYFLRPTPSLSIESSYPTVWDEDEVQILQGPIAVIGQDGKKVEMYEVVTGQYYYGQFYTDSDSSTGWIPRSAFGRVLP